MRQKFDFCNKVANNNLNNPGNLSEFLKGYLTLSIAMGKEEIANQAISELPPASSFNNPDPNVDKLIIVCEQNLMQQNIAGMTR